MELEKEHKQIIGMLQGYDGLTIDQIAHKLYPDKQFLAKRRIRVLASKGLVTEKNFVWRYSGKKL